MATAKKARRLYAAMLAAEAAKLRASPEEPVEAVPEPGKRPRTPIADPKSRHRIAMPASAGASKPMVCRNPGCSERLRYRQRDICCSPYCRDRLREMCQEYLDILDGLKPPEELPYFLRKRSRATFIQPTEVGASFAKENADASRAEEARGLREDGNQRRWHRDVRVVREETAGAQRSSHQDREGNQGKGYRR